MSKIMESIGNFCFKFIEFLAKDRALIVIKLGYWNNAALDYYYYQRIYLFGYKWTPFCLRLPRVVFIGDDFRPGDRHPDFLYYRTGKKITEKFRNTKQSTNGHF